MAKKVVASLKREGGVTYTRVVRMERSPKTGAYTFKEAIVESSAVKDFLAKKNILFSWLKKGGRLPAFFRFKTYQ